MPRPEFAGYLYQEHILQGIYQEIPGDFQLLKKDNLTWQVPFQRLPETQVKELGIILGERFSNIRVTKGIPTSWGSVSSWHQVALPAPNKNNTAAPPSVAEGLPQLFSPQSPQKRGIFRLSQNTEWSSSRHFNFLFFFPQLPADFSHDVLPSQEQQMKSAPHPCEIMV